MRVATEHLEQSGWRVEDVSTTRSYDLHCTAGAETLYVEVKGTTGDGSAVLLTPNEVAFARERSPATGLLVVSQVVLEAGDEGPVCSEGVLRLVHPWDPDAGGDLHPMGYRYAFHAS
jgi:hypothetical protein